MIGQTTDADNEGYHDIGQYGHLQELDKSVAEYFQPGAIFAKEKAAQNPQHKAEENAAREAQPKSFLGFCSHIWLLLLPISNKEIDEG